MTDDLGEVLDDADLVGDLEVSSGEASIDGDALSWSGALAAGASATITYTVAYTGEGDQRLINEACVPDLQAGEDENCATVMVPGSQLTFSKSSSSDDDPLVAGSVVEYVLSFNGQDGVIRVTGSLDAGETVTVVYTVTVNEDGARGDNEIRNAIFDTITEERNPLDGAECDTVTYVPEIVSGKKVDPASGTDVVAGQELTYTLTFTNKGTATGEFAREDRLTHVLDDADIIAEPVSSSDAVTAVRDGDVIHLAGLIEPKETVTVTYNVKVKDADARGDDVLGNFLIEPGDPFNEEEREDCAIDATDCTFNEVGEIVAVKSVDPKSGTKVNSRDTLTYTIQFHNTGQGTADVEYVDHLADVLDDAVLTGDVAAGDGLTASRDGDTIAIGGRLDAGATATVTYQVKVKAYDEQGDHAIANFVTKPGGDVPEKCVEENPLCTHNEVEPPAPGLAITGGQSMALVTGLALLALVGGGGAIWLTRRKQRVLAFGEGVIE